MAKVCKFQLEKEMVSYDCGQIWSPTGNKRKIPGQDPVEKPSEDCGWTGVFEYKWEADDTGFTCNGYDKYSTKVQYLSYDQGETWSKVEGSEQIGTLLEQFSSDCCYIRTTTGTTCDAVFRLFNATIEEASLDQELWVYTGRYTINSKISDFSQECLDAVKDNLKFFGKPVSGTSGTSVINCDNYLSECDDSEYIMNSGYVIICCEAGNDYCHSNTSDAHCSWYSYEDSGNIEDLYVFDCADNPSFWTNSQNTLKKIHVSSGVTGTFGGVLDDYIDFGDQFANCTGLTEIEGLGSSRITGIALDMFEGCTSLTSVELPASLTTLCGGAFASCTSLSSVTFNNKSFSLTYRSQYGQFSNCTSLTTINFANDFHGFLYSSMFSNCTSLTNVVIPENVNVIGDTCFNGCTSLTSVTFGYVQEVQQRAFQGCSALTDVYVTGTLQTEVWSNSFPSTCIFHVPASVCVHWSGMFPGRVVCDQ